MSSSTIQHRQTPQEIFAAIEQLEPDELDQLGRRLLQMQAQRKAPHLATREAELLGEIYREKRTGFQIRYDELNAKRRTFTLTREEQDELRQLNVESEAFTLSRLQPLAELAQLRSVSLSVLMQQLGLKAPPVG